MNYIVLLEDALGAFLSKSATFTVDAKYSVTVSDTAGAPVHLNLEQAMLVVAAVLGGATGTFQSGDITVVVAPLAAA